MELGLKGKKVFVTASSGGIGLAIARCFLDEGCAVMLNGREHSKLELIQRVLMEQYGEQTVFSFCGNMEIPAEVERARAYVQEKFDILDVLIGNLGNGKPGTAPPLSYEEWNRVFNINLFSNALLVETMLDVLDHRGSNIVFTSSIAGRESTGAPPAYAAAKSGLESLVKSLSWTLSEHHIRVNAVAPGNILFPGGRWEELLAQKNSQIQEMLIREVPLGRFGSPEEVAKTVVFLASPCSAFTNGSIFVVDGGQTRSY